MLRLIALAAASAVLALSAVASACMIPLDLAEARLRQAVPADALEIERHAGPAVAAVVGRLNAEPPETDFVADSLLIAYWRGRPGAVVLLGREGCLAGRIVLPASLARLLFGDAL